MMTMFGAAAANTSAGPSMMDRVTPMPSMVVMVSIFMKNFLSLILVY